MMICREKNMVDGQTGLFKIVLYSILVKGGKQTFTFYLVCNDMMPLLTPIFLQSWV